MIKCLFIILAIKILAMAYIFFMLLSSYPLYAVIALLLGIIDLIPTIALIYCLNSIDELKYEQNKLFYKLKKTEEELFGTPNAEKSSHTANLNKDTAPAVWECVKCGTVNKAETDCCSNCKAPYSPFINPTDNPYAKKKVSRWIKFK